MRCGEARLERVAYGGGLDGFRGRRSGDAAAAAVIPLRASCGTNFFGAGDLSSNGFAAATLDLPTDVDIVIVLGGDVCVGGFRTM